MGPDYVTGRQRYDWHACQCKRSISRSQSGLQYSLNYVVGVLRLGACSFLSVSTQPPLGCHSDKPRGGLTMHGPIWHSQ